MSNSNHLGQVITFEPRATAKRELDLEIEQAALGAGRMVWATGSSTSNSRMVWATGSAQSNSRMVWATGSAGSARTVASVAA